MPVQIGDVTYTVKDLEDACKAFDAVGAGLLDELFGDSAKLWKFGTKSLFFNRLVMLKEWNKSKPVPQDAFTQFKTPAGGEQVGTVVVGLGFGKGDVRFNNSKELLEHKLFRIFTLPADDLDRLRMLAADPTADRWGIPDWGQLEKLLEFWKEQDVPPQNWSREESVAGQFLAYRTAQQAMSVKDRYDPDTKGVGCTKKELAAAWGNCGQAATHLIGRVQDLGGQVEKTYFRVFTGASGAADLGNVLTADVSAATLVHISNPVLHEFTIERRGSEALLQQGYQGAYSALWWAGFDNITTDEFTLSGQAADKMRADRDRYGKGAQLELRALAGKLGDFITANLITDEIAIRAWQQLPFYSAETANDSAVPEWQVTMWVVRNPDAVLSALAAKAAGHDWLTMAVLHEAADVLRNAK